MLCNFFARKPLSLKILFCINLYTEYSHCSRRRKRNLEEEGVCQVKLNKVRIKLKRKWINIYYSNYLSTFVYVFLMWIKYLFGSFGDVTFLKLEVRKFSPSSFMFNEIFYFSRQYFRYKSLISIPLFIIRWQSSENLSFYFF